MRVKIPSYAKEDARKALLLRESLKESDKFGLTREEAQVLKIDSGVERAKQIIRNQRLSEEDAKKVARFYARFKNCKTKKCEGAIDLWGGRKFGREVYKKYYG